MKILIFSWRGPGHPKAGGAEQATFEHAKIWSKKGFDVTWFTSSFDKARMEENIEGVNFIRRGDEILGVQIKAIWWYLFGDHKKFDIVVDEFHGIPFFTPLYIRSKKIGWIHEVAKEVWLMNPLKFPLNIIYGVLGFIGEPLIFRLFYTHIPFMTVSESTKEDLTKWGIYGNNIHVVKNGVTLDLPSRLPVKEKKKTAIYLGAVAKDKGIEDAIRAFAYINMEDSNWQYWVVGEADKNYLKFLESLVKELGLTKKIKFWGFVTNRQKFELLAKAHLLVNPSFREGWGLVNIEANSVRTPVVGYEVVGVKDSVINGKTGILCRLGDVDKLALNCIYLLSNPKEYRRMQQNALSWSKNFNWEKAGSRSFKLLNSLVGMCPPID